MMATRATWDEIKARRPVTPAQQEGYERARRGFMLGEQMRELRSARGLTQAQLAERMGTTQSVIARLEAGQRVPSLVTLERVATALEAVLEVRLLAS
jgi:ribosome-binding protein aMBF1 (putative translation factor)